MCINASALLLIVGDEGITEGNWTNDLADFGTGSDNNKTQTIFWNIPKRDWNVKITLFYTKSYVHVQGVQIVAGILA